MDQAIRLVTRLCNGLLIGLYACVAGGLLYLFHDQMFYLVPEDSWNFYRFLWCCSVSLTGGAIGLWVRYDGFASCFHYIIYYPALLAAIASLVFVVGHLSTATSGYLFYYFSGALCLILGVTVEYFLSTVNDIRSALLKVFNKT